MCSVDYNNNATSKGKRVSYLFIISILAVSFVISGCSLFGSGKKKSGDGSELSESDLDRFGSGNIPGAEGEGMFKDIHFDYDSSSLNDSARQNIEYNVQVLQQNPDASVTLEGHCDERGTAEYNMALGAERAKSVADTLVSYGISRARINTISYGEEIPLEPGNNEAAWARNRRVHFALRR